MSYFYYFHPLPPPPTAATNERFLLPLLLVWLLFRLINWHRQMSRVYEKSMNPAR